MADDLILPICTSSFLLVDFVPGSLTHWTKRQALWTAYWIFSLNTDILNKSTGSGNVTWEFRCEYDSIIHTKYYSKSCLHTFIHVINTCYQNFVVLVNNFKYICTLICEREREKIYIYNPTFIYRQSDLQWQIEDISDGTSCTDLRLTPRVGWMLQLLQHQGKQARLFHYTFSYNWPDTCKL